jgi:hypothetical protein
MNREFLRPPLPLYRTGAVLVLPIFVFLAYQVAVFTLSPLQRFYWTDYVKTTFAPLVPTMPAFPSFGGASQSPVQELAETETMLVDSDGLPVVSETENRARGIDVAKVAMKHAIYNAWLAKHVYHRRPVLGFLIIPEFVAAMLFVILAGVGYRLDQKRLVSFRSSKARHIKGPELVEPAEFASRVKGDGIGFLIERGRWRKPTLLRIKREVEPQHQMLQGDNGAGKTIAMFALADQFEAMGETCIYYDPDCQFIKRYWKPGDIILGADARAWSWSPAAEIDYSSVENARATAMGQGASLYPGREGTKEFFFVNCARQIYEHCMTNYRPNASELADLYTHADPLIDAIAKGTELEEMLSKNTHGLRASITSTLTQCLFALRQVSAGEEGKPSFNAREYVAMRGRRPSIFFTASEDTKTAFAPLHRLWIDSLMRQFLSQPESSEVAVRFFIDELPVLGELSTLPTATARGRKRGIDLIIGFQGRSQVKEIYQDLSESIFSAPFTKLLLHTGEPEGGEWASKLIGEEEAEWVVEHVTADRKRSYTTQTKTGRIVPSSDLGSLKNRHGYLRYEGFVVKIVLAIPPDRPSRTEAFIARTGTPPVRLPLPDLEAIKAKEAADKLEAAKQRAAASAPYQPAAPIQK